ncbi:MAG: helix-turn-helix transcriptional regulator [Gammaproteobacteria bacterium]|nr:MAG: helix-turn-helix transcriptional regulator [Gammaproteobacteria bacterium]
MRAEIAPPSDRLNPARPWLDPLAEAIENLDNDRCPLLLIATIGTVVDVEMAMSVVYSGRSRPVHVCDTFSDEKAKRGLANYVENTYVLNPFYAAYRQGLKGGVYRIRDLAPDAYFESEHRRSFAVTLSATEELGYVTDDWPQGMEEINVVVELPGRELAEISLMRPIRKGGFADADILALGEITPLVAAVYRRYWVDARSRIAHQGTDSAIEDAFDRFGGEILSPREREVAQLILRGHSGISIGTHLGISTTTVKTHRKNLYAKLGIATHFELFSLFLKGL